MSRQSRAKLMETLHYDAFTMRVRIDQSFLQLIENIQLKEPTDIVKQLNLLKTNGPFLNKFLG